MLMIAPSVPAVWPGRVAALACAATAAGLALGTDQDPHEVWSRVAAAGYLLVALTPLAGHPAAPWIAGGLAALLPLALLVAARDAAGGGAAFAQPEVRVVEDAAQRWVATGSPYPSAAETAALAGADGYFPYLPGMALFALPRAVAGEVWWTDARIAFAAVAVGGCWVGARAVRGRHPDAVGGWLLAGNPLVGLTLATGGHDLALAGLLVAALGLAAHRPGTAGLLAGAAAAMKPTAWPVALVLLVLLLHRADRPAAARFASAAVAPVVLLCVPFAVRSPALLVEHLVVFPTGLAAVPTPAGSPLPGAWIAALPGGRPVALAALLLAAAAALVRLRARPPLDATGAARFCSAALTVGMLLAPSSRVGWFVVPLLLAAPTMDLMTVRERVSRILGAVAGRRPTVGSMDPVTEPAPKVVKSDAEWRAELTPAEYQVLRKAGTERAFTGEYTDTTTTGVYSCRACGAELFRSDSKFESHCGWPSFFTPLAADAVIERTDVAMGMRRTEVLCATCHSHLGHVFEGEGLGTPTDLRYCINSVSLRLEPAER